MKYGVPVTICIGVICDSGKKAIVAADRMVTARGLSIEFEGEERKIIPLSDSSVAMTAGDALIHAEILGNAKAEIRSKSVSQVPQIVEMVKESFVEERKKRFEEKALRPRGITLEEFYGGRQRGLDANIIMRLDRQLEDAKLDLQVIVAGVDQNGGHVYALVDPGTAQCFNGLGFCGIGSGYPHAMSVLIFNNFNPSLPLNRAVYLVYEAKRRSESAPGVGREHTDIAAIGDKINYLHREELEQLRNIYEAKMKSEKPKEIDAMINDFKVTG